MRCACAEAKADQIAADRRSTTQRIGRQDPRKEFGQAFSPLLLRRAAVHTLVTWAWETIAPLNTIRANMTFSIMRQPTLTPTGGNLATSPVHRRREAWSKAGQNPDSVGCSARRSAPGVGRRCRLASQRLYPNSRTPRRRKSTQPPSTVHGATRSEDCVFRWIVNTESGRS
jgi:hypothetical protein